MASATTSDENIDDEIMGQMVTSLKASTAEDRKKIADYLQENGVAGYAQFLKGRLEVRSDFRVGYRYQILTDKWKKSLTASQSIESNIIRSDDTYAKDRIRSTRLKRNGINPTVITVSDIKLNNFLRLSSLKEALRQIEKLCWWSSNTK
ncbi:unnamed protein product [Rotaria magnacalcarata]|uniref:Uncharacterized protein n=5 Tax=Rotaria magnacalcarata TaxID=392030 RepID=A0A816QVE9_9BILA|nr:unnamed protein product [Rotaria magnacalcarata]CAF2064900.1 unnamed protein product [Rotaria magnacalcarata]